MQKIFLLILLISICNCEELKTRSIDLKIPSNYSNLSELDAEERITWGQSATNGQFPFAVYMRIIRQPIQFSCTGSLIGSTWVLSARRCFLNAANTPADSMQAFVGNVDRLSNQLESRFANWAVWQDSGSGPHPQIIIFRLTSPVPTTQFIAPVRLPRLADEHFGFDGADTVMLGWGVLFNNTVPRNLQFGSFRILAVHLCFWNQDFIPHDFCSQHSTLNNMVSAGDWGGPSIFWETDGQPTIIGVTSTTLVFPNGLAAISLRVSSFLRFINQQTGIPFR